MTDVPYFSQWQDPMNTSAILDGMDPCQDPNWTNSGFHDPNEYRYWATRMCGIACLRSILAAHSFKVPTQNELLTEALNRGVYQRMPDGSVLGMIYRPFCEWISEDYGFDARYFQDTPLKDALAHRSSEQFLILSVGSEIRETELANPAKGGHLVLVTTHDQNEIVFHNPSGIPPQHADVRLRHDVFDKFYAGRGIYIK